MELNFHKDPTIFARLIDGMPVGFFTVDAAGRFASWSDGAERITGYSHHDVVGQPCTILEGRNCKGFATLKDMLEHPDPCLVNGVCSQECKLLSKDGRELYIHGNVRVLTEDDGTVAGAAGCFSDLTEFVLANEKITLLEEQVRQRDAFERLVGRSQLMQEVFRRLRLAAQSEVTVFISGESGTGKELAASAIHSVSDRRDKPFIAVNCSAIPETLLESELFGHVKGAFTGAVRDKVGVFQAAEGGTLFLDEIGDISPLLQLKLLRVLQEREIRRVGDDHVMKINVRLLTATNRDLKELISQGDFREDFYYRIHVFEIHLPALRERKEDIPLLAERFTAELSRAHGRTVSGIARDALQRMLDYHWPGNVRELRNALEHAFVTVTGDTITLFDLPLEIRNPQVETPQEPPKASRSTPAAPARTREPAATSVSLSAAEEQDRQKLVAALQQSGGNKAAAARLLGVSRVTIWKKVKKYGLTTPKS
ncbi:MAG: sigma 54-interacting transcriptional regulator [Fuerstiella sp.]